MANRVTDQTTQNGLIQKFKLDGVLPEMEVLPSIVPVVQVATLTDALNISEFEKWRSVFSGGPPLIDPSDITNFPILFQAGTTNVVSTTHVVSPSSVQAITGNGGCALPGASVGVPATDGIYRITAHGYGQGNTTLDGNVVLTDQAAFGAGVALGTVRSTIGGFSFANATSPSNLFFDFFL